MAFNIDAEAWWPYAGSMQRETTPKHNEKTEEEFPRPYIATSTHELQGQAQYQTSIYPSPPPSHAIKIQGVIKQEWYL